MEPKLIEFKIPAPSSTPIAATTRISAFDWRPQADEYDPSISTAVEACAAFAHEVKSGGSNGGQPRWLTITGKPGCGKTMLARQTYDKLRRGATGLQAPYFSWFDATAFASRLRDGDYELPEAAGDQFLVVLDDLGTARDKSDFIAEALYRFCAARLRKWTIFTSNLSIPEIADRIDERVASRLIRDENVALRITAGDYALRKLAK